MLVIWSAADAQLLKSTVGASLLAMRPEVPPHRFAPLNGEALIAQPGEVVLTCGTRPLEFLKKAGFAPKNRGLKSLREHPLRPNTSLPGDLSEGQGGAPPNGSGPSPSTSPGAYLVTYDPAIVGSEPDKKAVIDWDLRLATRLLTTGRLDPEVGSYRWVGSFAELIAAINCKADATGEPVDVAMDIETMGLHPWYPGKDMVSIGFTSEAGRADCLYAGPFDDPVDPDPSLVHQLTWLLTSTRVKLRGANLKYDLIWIAEKWGLECTNFKLDTCLVGSLLDENRGNSLNQHAKQLTTMGGYDSPFNATVDKNHMERVPPDKLLPYQGGDVDATFRVADAMREQLLADGRLARFYVKVLHPAARAFERIERRGVVIDRQKYAQLGDDLGKEIKRLEAAALDLMPRRFRIKHRDKIDAQLQAGKSPFTPRILEDYFFGSSGLHLTPKMTTEKSGRPSTSRIHLRMFAGHPAASRMCAVLEEMNGAAKTRSTFVDGFLKHVRPDGRLHPVYMLHHGGFLDDEDDESGTVTGRLAAKEPAIQTLPKRTRWAKRLRECFTAPEGHLTWQADFAQGELRIAACVAPEPKMIRAYQEGIDLHAITAASLAGMSLAEFEALEKTDKHRHTVLRTGGKAGNFGLLYGMSAEGFQDYAWAVYGVQLTLPEAEAFRHRFLYEQWTGLPAYHDRQRALVQKQGWVRSPLGRIRHLPTIWSWDRSVRAQAERQAINSPIQSTLSDMMLMAIAIIEAELPEVQIAIMTHDSTAGYVPIKTAEANLRDIVRIMSTLPLAELGWIPLLDFPADAELGPDLAHLEPLAA